MLRTLLLSVLLGAAGSLLALLLAYGSFGNGGAPHRLDTRSVEVTEGVRQAGGGALAITLNALGRSAVNLPVAGLAAQDYPYLHIGLADYPRDLRMNLAWKHSGDDAWQILRLEMQARDSQWIAIREIHRWRDDLSKLQLFFFGTPGETLLLQDLALHPAGLGPHLNAMLDDLTRFVPWRPGDINSHSGATKSSPFYLAQLFAMFMLFCLGGFALLTLLRSLRQPPGKRAAPDWTAAGLLFLLCWFALDALWQYKLLRQLGETRALFAGKTTPEKLAVGPDAELYKFVTRARSLMRPADARVFVSANDEYSGLRGAYYMYPYNAYWKKGGPELPHPYYLRPGDYVLVLRPAGPVVSRRQNRVITPEGGFDVDILLADSGRLLLRVR